MAATRNSEVGSALLFITIRLDDLAYGRFGKGETFL
jgi:hypothetical protein